MNDTADIPEPPKRRRPDPGVLHPPGEAVIVFVTVCAKDRTPWLAAREVHDLLVRVWTQATAWRVGRYAIMPDHIHLFAAPWEPDFDLDAWIAYWKSQFTKAHKNPAHRWQRTSWHTRLRPGQSWQGKWEYVVNNPVRHGLVANAEDWPYQGEVWKF